jgi:hypothetical protein
MTGTEVILEDTLENIKYNLFNLGFVLILSRKDIYHVKVMQPKMEFPTSKLKSHNNYYNIGELLPYYGEEVYNLALNAGVIRQVDEDKYKLAICNNGTAGLTEYHRKIADNFFG